MPNRILREGILTSERVDLLSLGSEVFYRRLISVVDDFGRYYATTVLLRSACFPLRIDSVSDNDVSGFLLECEKAGLISLYKSGGKQYLQLTDFRQQVRAKESKFPQPHSECVADGAQEQSSSNASAHLDVDEDVDEDVSGKGAIAPFGAGAPSCPHQEIISLYAEHLPMGTQIKDWTPARAKTLQTRWREKSERQNLDWWQKFFAYCAESDFLCGRVSPTPGRDPFTVSLPWLLESRNFVSTLEGKYHRGAA